MPIPLRELLLDLRCDEDVDFACFPLDFFILPLCMVPIDPEPAELSMPDIDEPEGLPVPPAAEVLPLVCADADTATPNMAVDASMMLRSFIDRSFAEDPVETL